MGLKSRCPTIDWVLSNLLKVLRESTNQMKSGQVRVEMHVIKPRISYMQSECVITEVQTGDCWMNKYSYYFIMWNMPITRM